MGQGDVATADRPAVALAKIPGQGLEETRLALRRIVIRQGFDQRARLVQFGEHFREHRLDLGDGSGIAPAQHDHAGLRQALAQIVHEVRNTRIAVEMLTEI